MPEMQDEKVHLPGTKKNADAPGAPLRRCGTPVAITFSLPGPGFQVIQGNRMRPRPQWGQGWRKGGQMTMGIKSQRLYWNFT